MSISLQDAPRHAPVAPADEPDPHVHPVELVAAPPQQPAVEVHQVQDLAGRARPVLGGERVDGQPLDADLDGALDRVPERLLAGAVALGARQAALLRPPAVAVHHDRDVGGHLGAVDVVEVAAHRAVRTSIGTERIRRSRWYSVKPTSIPRASVDQRGSGRSAAADERQVGAGERREQARGPRARPRRRSASAHVGADRAAEPGRPQPHVGCAADRAGGERRVEPRQRQQLQPERLRHRRRVARPGVERAQPVEQEHRERDVALVLLGDLVDRLDHRLGGREQREVVADLPVGGHDLGLRHGVERAAPAVQHQVDVGEGLEATAEPRGGLAKSLGDRADLAGALGEDGHDLVGLTELHRAQDDPLLLIGGHTADGISRTLPPEPFCVCCFGDGTRANGPPGVRPRAPSNRRGCPDPEGVRGRPAAGRATSRTRAR